MIAQPTSRNWRPSTFGALAGQEHVATTLRQAVRQDRVAHSYMFCGPRGCGKTTTARILAKAVNCLDNQDGDACNACANCRLINAGEFLDITELDAASNRGVEDVRDILSKTHFAPVQGHRKVYIIDEAHMLTEAASSILANTLENPPKHITFILCTTEIHKIASTIVPRCQRMDFRRIPIGVITERLATIADHEGVNIDSQALELIARDATGSLRDAEKNLEKLVVTFPQGVTEAQVMDLSGNRSDQAALDLTISLTKGDVPSALAAVNRASWQSGDLRQFQKQVSDLLRAFMHFQCGAADSVNLPEYTRQQLADLADQYPHWPAAPAIRAWNEVDMRQSSESSLPLEIAASRICQDAAAPEPAPQLPAPEEQKSKTPPQPGRETLRPRPPNHPSTSQANRSQANTLQVNTPQANTPQPPGIAARWTEVIKSLSKNKGRKYNLGALLRDCRAETVTLDDTVLTIPFKNRTNLERIQEELENPGSKTMMYQAVTSHFGPETTYNLTLAAQGPQKHTGQNTTPLVTRATNMGARIVEHHDMDLDF